SPAVVHRWGTRACTIGTVEALENELLDFRSDAGARIRDSDHIFAVPQPKFDVDRASMRRELDRIVEQVPHHLAQEFFVPVKGSLWECWRRQFYCFLRSEYRRRANRFRHEFVEIKLGGLEQRMAGIGTRQHKHVFDDARQATSLLFDDSESLTVFVLLTLSSLQRHRRGRADDRKRSAQFMRGISHKPSLLGERSSQP